ncbi:hypothetical protein IAE16_07660 [Hydrogenobacter sp. T-2]|uniref:hypothetical protein n=1 Tax=Pampinifervens diazotrophicum TaxID=1632018 RepID=UPI002B263709|nr:hypothetical protein [Hydrogenobacter sp. T-2]WPM31694.1 hypothetical protein IAE16_07660 [Hydrogenobacter sp. T-2]
MKKALAVGALFTLSVGTANALDFSITPVVGSFQQKANYRKDDGEEGKVKYDGTFYGLKIGLGHSFGNVRLEGDLSAYYVGDGNVKVEPSDYTSSKYKHVELQGEGRVGYKYDRFEGNLKGVAIAGYIPIGYSFRKMDVDYLDENTDGSYSDDYKYLYTGLGMRLEYKMLYLDGKVLLPLKNKVKLDKSYAGEGSIEKDMGKKVGYNVSAGIKWKLLTAGVFYERREHKSFYDHIDRYTASNGKEERLGLQVGFVF